MTTNEVAELLRCKPQRVRELRMRGALPAIHEGGRRLHRRGDIVAYLARSAVLAAPAMGSAF
jgi:excisionase family DNA binding protein